MGFFKNLFGNKESDDIKPSASKVVGEVKFEDIKNKIYPYFKQLSQSGGATQSLPEDLSQIDNTITYEVPELKLVIFNVCEDLNCLYVIDNDTGFEIIQELFLEKWNISKEELHNQAIENFRTLLLTKLSARGDSNGMMFVIDGNLEAGLVLIDEIWEQLEDQLGDEIVITVPSRDVLLATGKSNQVMIEAFTKNSINTLKTADYPLSKNWFIRQDGQWKLFKRIMT